jgi:hypothetical protein
MLAEIDVIRASLRILGINPEVLENEARILPARRAPDGRWIIGNGNSNSKSV